MSKEVNVVFHDMRNEGGRMPMMIKALDRAIHENNPVMIEKILNDLEASSAKLGVLIAEVKSELQAVEEVENV